MLVVAEEKATVALTLVAAHGIDADLLTATIVVLTLIHICEKRKRRGEKSHLGLEARMPPVPLEEPLGAIPQRCSAEVLAGGPQGGTAQTRSPTGPREALCTRDSDNGCHAS